MRTLIVGTGGREHSLAWGLFRSGGEVVCAPGNPGMAGLGRCLAVDASDPGAVAALADDIDADLVVVGGEAPLVAGVVDAVQARGRLAFGPTAAGARLEGSKAWMKEVLAEAGVPTARHGAFTDESRALEFLETLPGFYVVKTDGLAAGKGVHVTESLTDARQTVHAYLSGAAFGEAGRRVVIEEGLTGPELSLLVLCDGTDFVPLAPAQDFKRIGEGDTGPNTGGMGAYSPVPFVSPEVTSEVVAKAVGPTLDALARRGVTYRGILYAGLMLTPEGPKILEYNVRFGDPECQVVLPRLASDLGAHLRESAEGRLRTAVEWRDDACVTVVLASEHYPASPRTGDAIEGLEEAGALPGVTIFHAGTRRDSAGVLRTGGGRVLDVTAVGSDLSEARERAYGAVGRIAWPGVVYRRDIAAAATGGGAPPT